MYTASSVDMAQADFQVCQVHIHLCELPVMLGWCKQLQLAPCQQLTFQSNQGHDSNEHLVITAIGLFTQTFMEACVGQMYRLVSMQD